MNDFRIESHLILNSAPTGNESLKCSGLAADTDSADSVFACVELKQSASIQILHFTESDTKSGKSNVIADIPCLPPPQSDNEPYNTAADESDMVVDFKYLPDKRALFLATRFGDLFLISEKQQDWQVESIGYIDAGLHDVKWSPDEETVLFVTGNGTLLLMTSDFEFLREQPIVDSNDQDNFGRDAFISVGWGKKETQFHGSLGKSEALRKPSTECRLSPNENGRMVVSWRGDGAYCACSSLSSKSQNDENAGEAVRLIRVFDRELNLISTSELVQDVEPLIAWKPSGSLIASVQTGCNQQRRKTQVIFYERNGLRHGEFGLRLPNDEEFVVESLQWNVDSTSLMVIAREKVSQRLLVQFWWSCNYHWYLKYQFRAGPNDYVKWDNERPMKWYWFNSSLDDELPLMHLNIYQFNPLLIRNSNIPSAESKSFVAMTDGNQIQLTPFKLSMVPPPMAYKTLQIPNDANVCDIAYSLFDNGNSVAALTSDGSIFVHREDESNPRNTAIVRYSPTTYNAQSYFRQILWISDSQMLTLETSALEGDLISLVELNHESLRLSVVSSLRLEAEGSGILSMYSQLLSRGLEVFFIDSKQNVYSVSGINDANLQHNLTGIPIVKRPKQLYLFRELDDHDEDSIFAVYISKNGRQLYINDHQISNTCSSMFLRRDMLIFTTTEHEMRFIPTHLFKQITDGSLSSIQFPEFVRKLERGSSLVTVLQNDTGVVLQMPRGNLEIIHPRALVISQVITAIDEHDFAKALALTRKHRLDMNLLFDYSPEKFFANIREFVLQIENVDHLNLFLSDLRDDENAMAKLPWQFFPGRVADSHSNVTPDKINRVCGAVRSALEEARSHQLETAQTASNNEDFLNAILITYVRQSPPLLEDMLRCISSGDLFPTTDAQERAIQFIRVFVDVGNLFDIALGLYDLELTVLVAQQTNKDPKEYLPFIKELKSYQSTIHYQHFKIDNHLKRYELALDNLVRHYNTQSADESDQKYLDKQLAECLEFIKRRGIYRYALKLYSGQSGPVAKQMYKAISHSFAKYLEEESKYQDAGYAYLCAGDKLAAFECFKRTPVLAWKELFAVASQLGMDQKCEKEELSTLKTLADDVAEELAEAHKYADASTVLQEYAQDTNGAFKMLVRGHLWWDAWRLASRLPDFESLVDNYLIPAASSQVKNLLDDIKDVSEQFCRLSDRLQIVRTQKYNFANDGIEIGNSNTDNVAGLLGADAMTEISLGGAHTVVSTVRTAFSKASTMRTGKTAKSRRKTDRKKHDAKEGSVFEEDSLVDKLGRLVKRANEQLRTDIAALLQVLPVFHMHLEAVSLQRSFEQLLKDVIGSRINSMRIFKPVRPDPNQLPETIKIQLENCMRDGTSRDVFDAVIRMYAPPSTATPESNQVSSEPWKSSLVL